MNRTPNSPFLIIFFALCAVTLSGCPQRNVETTPTPEPNLTATFDAAVAATVEFEAQVKTSVAQTVEASAPPADPTATNTPLEVAIADTSTPEPEEEVEEPTGTFTPVDTDTPEPKPTDTETPIQIVLDPPVTATAPPPTATFTPQPPTATFTPPPPTYTFTPVPPTATYTPPPPTATYTPPPPTETPIQIVVDPVDGNNGDENIRSRYLREARNGQAVLLPGFDPNASINPPTFRNQIVFQVEVFDDRVGTFDGAGIDRVEFEIRPSTDGQNGNGDPVYKRTERQAGYCVFGGGEPNCGVLFIGSGQPNTWPSPDGGQTPIGGGPIYAGQYRAFIDIFAQSGQRTQWRWDFRIENPALAAQPGQAPVDPPTVAPPPQVANTARILNIQLDGTQYRVDFEAAGFAPTLPGQHLHFFFNNVPPEQAGLPGGGPWQIYPGTNGGSGASPFTLLGPANNTGGATQLCVLVANPDHSVNQGTGNCVDLP